MNSTRWELGKSEFITRWVKDIDPDNILPEYPRPQMQREKWLNLNGFWDYAILPKKINKATQYVGQILVPFPVESVLSRVKKRLTHRERIWYKRFFKIPAEWNYKTTAQKILLNFGAVDWHCMVWINEKKCGEHKGGYTPFSIDITEALYDDAENELVVAVWDPTDKKGYPRGKQKLKAYGIWYTPCSGIWQTVWIEPVPENYITSLEMKPEIDKSRLYLKINTYRPCNDEIHIVIKEDGKEIARFLEKNTQKFFTINIPNQKLWSPDNPFLYELEVSLLAVDKVKSYFGMRKISIKEDESGNKRLALNNKILFQYGTLDQGYWPDGIYTAPTDEALRYDIEITKELGFNMIRKHVKVEPARWYYWCDKLGILVWQDMPTGGKTGLLRIVYGLLKSKKNKDYDRPKEEKEVYYNELKAMIKHLYNYPSIIVWVPFNEGWGQFETSKVLDFTRSQDSTRLIDIASGWFDHKIGDIADCHKYIGPGFPNNVEGRVPVCGEFGGLGLKIKEHVWKKKLKFVYKKFQHSKGLQEFYAKLIYKLKNLKNQGLSAAVYTQITDVEGEINGLLTYDREYIKIEKKKLKEINLTIDF
ncbi:MAG: glycoside hydrolase family 2 protein [Promethearchaeota archaeon]